VEHVDHGKSNAGRGQAVVALGGREHVRGRQRVGGLAIRLP
jgi:hypothetical protein